MAPSTPPARTTEYDTTEPIAAKLVATKPETLMVDMCRITVSSVRHPHTQATPPWLDQTCDALDLRRIVDASTVLLASRLVAVNEPDTGAAAFALAFVRERA